jgi:hypothetical protein
MMLKLVVGRSAEVIEYCSQHEYKAKWKEQRTGNEGILGKTRRVGFFFLFGSYLLADAGIIETKKASRRKKRQTWTENGEVEKTEDILFAVLQSA